MQSIVNTERTLDPRDPDDLLNTGYLQRAIFNSENFSSIATDARGVIQIFIFRVMVASPVRAAPSPTRRGLTELQGVGVAPTRPRQPRPDRQQVEGARQGRADRRSRQHAGQARARAGD